MGGKLLGGTMLRKRILWLMIFLSTLAWTASVSAHGQVWNFLGNGQIHGTRDHDRIEVTRHEAVFRTIQLRVSNDAIFFDRVVVNFGNRTSQTFPVGDRISPEGKNYVLTLDGGGHAVESVELWYFKEPWQHNPRISLYGTN